jgi:hypothetical protein
LHFGVGSETNISKKSFQRRICCQLLSKARAGEMKNAGNFFVATSDLRQGCQMVNAFSNQKSRFG